MTKNEMTIAKIPLFNSIPVRIDILNSSLQLTTSIFLLGDQDKKVKQSISSDGIYSKNVETIFGKHFVSKATPIKGGDIDWEELDDEDFESIINAEPTPIIQYDTSNKPTKKDIKVSEVIDYDITVFKEDTILDVQKKIALVTKIEPIKQYLSKDHKCLTHYINFHSSFDSHIDNVDLIEFLQSCDTKIKDIPIDESYLFTKDSSTIVNTQYNKLSDFLDPNENSLRLVLISLDTVITDKNAIQFLLRSDKQSFELIFESFIERFYIMITSQVFTNYLANETDFDINKYKSIITNRSKVIDNLNSIPKVNIKDDNLTVVTNAITLRSESNDNALVVLPKLFNNFIISDIPDVFYLDLFVSSNNRLNQLRKVSKYASQAINLVEDISMNIRPLASNIREYKIKDRLVITLLPSNNFSKLIISIDIFGRIEICAYSNRTTEITKDLFISEISSFVKNIIDYLNKINDAYLSPLRLNPNLNNYKMIKSTSNLIFNKRIDYDNAVKYMITDLSNTGILEVESISNVNMKTRIFKIYSDNVDATKIIQIYSNSKLAAFTLFDLSSEETAFYVDLIGRFINYRSNDIEIKISNKNNAQASDPVLYKYKSKSNMNYSRVCQRKFQPILADPTDKKAYKYHNFTFNEPQYYKCPTKENPFMGLLSGYHPNGFCLPCCRKQEQPNYKNISNACIKGESLDELPKLAKTTNKFYVIDYPNDLISNNRLVDRLSNVPDFINKMLTKGSKLLVNGASISYSESTLDSQVLNILVKYLNKKSIRELILSILEFLKNTNNHRKVMSMPNISYSFTTINELIDCLSAKFLKQSLIKASQNWNDIIIDIAVAMDVGIVLLSDNRIRASDCEHVVSQAEECSNEPITTTNVSIKMLKLEYVDLDKPVIILLRRVDTEYSKVHNNRRYFYFPISSSVVIEPKIEAALPTVISQLKKIKSITQQPITNIIDKSYDYKSLEQSIQGIGKIKTLYGDADNYVAYGEVSIGVSKTLLISLYRTANQHQHELKKILNKSTHRVPASLMHKTSSYTGGISDVLKLLENHNKIHLSEDSIITSFKDYLSVNMKLLANNKPITLPIGSKYLLKIDKFIVHKDKVVGTKVVAINGKMIIHTNIIYHKSTSINDVLKLIKSTQGEINNYRATIKDAKTIAITGLDLIKRTVNGTIFSGTQLGTNTTQSLLDHKDYFIEYLVNPIDLVDSIPEPVDYPNNNILKRAQYMNNIYKIMISTMINYWKTSKPIELLQAIKKLIEDTKPDILKNLSSNLIEDWIDKLILMFTNTYHPNVIKAEMYEFSSYIQSNIRVKTKESIIKALFESDVSLNDIELHNISYTYKAQIKQLVVDTASKCLSKTDSIPEIILNKHDTSDVSIFEQYHDKQGKLLILKSIYSDLLNLAVDDLSNPFRREYVLNNCMINSFVNTVKIKSHIDELIYMQEL